MNSKPTRREARRTFRNCVETAIKVLHINRQEAEKRTEWVLWGGIQEEIGIAPDPEDPKWQMVVDVLMQIPTEKHGDWKNEFVRVAEANKQHP